MGLYRSFATVGGLTMVSRLLGFVRDQLMAFVLGTGWVADAFIVAFRIPNLFRRLFAEGAFNSAFVPLFSERLEGQGQDQARRFAEEALSGLLLVLGVLTLLVEIFMPWFLRLIAFGFVGTPEKFDLAVLLSRIAFPYLICMSLMALYAGVLSALRHFAIATAAQVLLNVVLISFLCLAFWLGLGNAPEAGILLAVGVTTAGILQLVMVAYECGRKGMRLRLCWPGYSSDLGRLLRLGGPALLAGGITQINIVVGTNIASLQAGANSYLYYADRLYQLPLGIVGVAVGVVLLPDIARHLRAGRIEQVTDSQNRATEFALLLTLPSAVALAAIPGPIIQVLFERGAFTAADTPPTAWALAAFAFGLPAFVLNKVLSPVFFAREDTRTPMYFALVNLLVNAAGSIALFFLLRHWGLMPHVGIAIATTIAAWLNVYQLWRELRQRGHFHVDDRLKRNVSLVVMASLLMGVVILLASVPLAPYLARPSGLLTQVAALLALVSLGTVVYGLTIQLTGVTDLRSIARRAVRR